MAAISLSDQLGIADFLSVQVTESPGVLADFLGIADAFSVQTWTQPNIPAQGAALNSNPDFGSGGVPSATGWATLNGTLTASASPPAGCPQATAGQFANNGVTVGSVGESSAPVTLTPGCTPVMTCWVYSSSGQVKLALNWQNSGHTLISGTSQTFQVPVNTWVQLAFAAEPLWSSGAAYVYPSISPNALSQTVWCTAVILTFQAPIAPAFSAVAAQTGPSVFVRSVMPVMHVQNLLTGQWYHRNVQGITSPSITWNLNAADTFTCTISPPRADLMDATGNPLLKVWRDACYLEEDGAIKFGGILTGSSIQGAAWQQSYTGFAGYPNGLIYEGANYVVTFKEAMEVIRYLWAWVQTQVSNIGMVVDATNTGVQLGAQLPSLPIVGALASGSHHGDKSISIVHPDQWTTGDVLRIGDEGSTYTVKSISGHVFTLNRALKGDSGRYQKGATVTQVVAPTPFALYWYNSTDIGQEIEAIRQEAVFDWREVHAWQDGLKSSVSHTWKVGVHRLGTRRTDLRFAEGENIVSPATGTQDGSLFADKVVGLGYGSGSSTVRTSVHDNSGRLGRQFVYTNQTVTNKARMTVMARKVLASRLNIDTISQVVVVNHPNAPFGSFFCGDDIPVTLCTGWRNATVWSRITSIAQDPTTQLMTLALARSDSFNYLAESGQAGTL